MHGRAGAPPAGRTARGHHRTPRPGSPGAPSGPPGGRAVGGVPGRRAPITARRPAGSAGAGGPPRPAVPLARGAGATLRQPRLPPPAPEAGRARGAGPLARGMGAVKGCHLRVFPYRYRYSKTGNGRVQLCNRSSQPTPN